MNIPKKFESDTIVLITADRNVQVLGQVKSWVVKAEPYEMKVIFDDDSCLTVNLWHVLVYTFVPGDSE